jgi:RNA methyltransferase, TrmH family
MNAPVPITSRDNPLLKELRKLAVDGTAYRKSGRVWIEGEHLCAAYLCKGFKPSMAIFVESKMPPAHLNIDKLAIKSVVVSDVLMAEISSLDSLPTISFICDLPAATAIDTAAPTVVLDRLQDPGNVGSILRSAAAFGFKQIIALKGSVALWSPKVLRAGMGAHFGLQMVEGASLDDVASLQLPLAVTSSHQGQFLHHMLENKTLPAQINWALGHEGQGVCEALMQQAGLHVRIAQPGGEESLNVAVAAAICLYASACVAL